LLFQKAAEHYYSLFPPSRKGIVQNPLPGIEAGKGNHKTRYVSPAAKARSLSAAQDPEFQDPTSVLQRYGKKNKTETGEPLISEVRLMSTTCLQTN